jgi:hypothetical protein
MRVTLSVRWLPAVALLVLSGCAGNGESGAYAKVPVGSVVQLHERIEIPPDQTRIWFKGDTLGLGAGSFNPVCALEVHDASVEVQYVEPGDFRIRKVEDLWTEIVYRAVEPDGGVGFRLASADRVDDDATLSYEGYHLWLGSGEQPRVMRLTCVGIVDDMPESRPPTIEEIRSSLGRYATLKIPGRPD